MMNHIWAGLIVFSLLFALISDISDRVNDSYQNERIEEITLLQPRPRESSHQNVDQHAKPQQAVRYITQKGDTLSAILLQHKMGTELILPYAEQWVTRWKDHYQLSEAQKRGQFRVEIDVEGDKARFQLPPVKWIKIKAITQAAIDMADVAVNLALGLIGVMALWLGLMKIAEQAGLVESLSRLVRPLLIKLYPDIPAGDPALGAITLNLTANVLGLSNAATPLGIKAMEELQRLNQGNDKASHAMCMFLTMNTSSVQLLPPATLVAIMGLGISELMISITLATLCSTVAGIGAALYFRRREEIKTQKTNRKPPEGNDND